MSGIAVFLLSGVSAYIVARRLRLPGRWTVQALAVFILWEAFEIIPVQVLATLQLLHVIERVSIPKTAAIEVFILGTVVLWSRLAPRREQVSVDQEPKTIPRYLLLAGGILACSYVAFAINGFTCYPLGSDVLIYHLPITTRWLQEGSLAIPASHAWRFSLPGNAEIGMMVLLSSGWQPAVMIASWIPAAMVATSTYLLSMWISGQQRTVALASTLVVLSIPMLEWQAFSAYVDLLATAGVLSALALMLAAGRNGNRIPPTIWLLSGLACGISIGTKPVYYLYAALFCAFIAGALWQSHRSGEKHLVKAGALVVLGLLVPSCFWFGRAAVETGNPIYPMQVKLGHRVILPGYDRSEITEPDYELNSVSGKYEWFLYPWAEWKKLPGFLKIPYGEGDGLGAAFATFVPLGMVYFVLMMLRDPSARFRNLLLLAAFLVMFLCWWLVMQRVLRFGQVIAIFTCLLSVPLLGLLQSRQRRAFAVLFAVAIGATSLISASVPLHLLAGRVRKHLWSRAAVYSYPKLIDELPPGSRVLNATGDKARNFALIGNQLSNNLIANFEAPVEPTPEALHAVGAQYVVEIVPGALYPEGSLAAAGAVLVEDETVPSGEEKVRWRIWKLR
jgi:hypothetical protein